MNTMLSNAKSEIKKRNFNIGNTIESIQKSFKNVLNIAGAMSFGQSKNGSAQDRAERMDMEEEYKQIQS